jgi:hypothetical protein
MTLEPLEELPLSIKKLSQVTYLKEKLKKVKATMRQKIFGLTDVSGHNSSSENEMMEQLWKIFT